MTIKDKKNNNQLFIVSLSILVTLTASVSLSYLSLYLATQTGLAQTDMVTFVYAIGSLGTGLLALVSYIGTAAIIGIGISEMLSPTKS